MVASAITRTVFTSHITVFKKFWKCRVDANINPIVMTNFRELLQQTSN